VAEPFLGEIRMFGGDFAPRGWARCDGQLLRIAEYAPLFSLIGTSYGGDGVETFALPSISARLPLHAPAPGDPSSEAASQRRMQPITFIIALTGVFPGRP
jgi:microcystin-dependent protein